MIVDWPERKEGKPVTSGTNQSIWMAAALAASEVAPDAVKEWRRMLQASQNNWRHSYMEIVREFVEIMISVPTETLIAMCQAGLDQAESSFGMREETDDENGGIVMSLAEAFEKPIPQSQRLKTKTLTGSQPLEVGLSPPVQYQLASPHGTDSEPIWITGQNAIAQLETWEKYGCMEPSATHHAKQIIGADDLTEYVRDKTFCLLGLTSELGPAYSLLKIPGTHVMGVARAGPKLDRLTTWFQSQGPASCQLDIPENGADLLRQAPEIAHWILETADVSRPLVILPLAYMDGEANVRVSVAMDKIVSYILSQRMDVELVYYTSPTTVYTIPPEAAMDARRRYENQTPWTRMVSVASFGYWLRPADTWKQISKSEENKDSPASASESHPSTSAHNRILYNGVVHLQGPNYCLAKTLQQWRCIVEQARGRVVCAPHAPATRTISVTHNETAALAMEGLQYFPPWLVFDVQPCSSLMAAIMLNQLYTKEKSKDKQQQNQHPMELFWDGAVHGGGWRCPYSSDSFMELTYVLGKTIAQKGWCPEAALAPKPTRLEN